MKKNKKNNKLTALHLIFLPQLSCLRILYQCRGIKGHVVLLPLISCSVLEVGSWNRIYSLPSVPVVWSPSKKSFTISSWSSCCLYLAFVQSSTHAWISSDCGDIDERLGSKIFPPALNSCSTNGRNRRPKNLFGNNSQNWILMLLTLPPIQDFKFFI